MYFLLGNSKLNAMCNVYMMCVCVFVFKYTQQNKALKFIRKVLVLVSQTFHNIVGVHVHVGLNMSQNVMHNT